MKTIYKYHIAIGETKVLDLPLFAVPLAFQRQNNDLCLWVLLDFRNKRTERRFRIFGTGHNDVPDDAVYIGTAQVDEFVWHLFEVFS